jgi:hypothetical protein
MNPNAKTYKTINHRGTETQRKAREAKAISGFPAFGFPAFGFLAFGFLCASVSLWLIGFFIPFPQGER